MDRAACGQYCVSCRLERDGSSCDLSLVRMTTSAYTLCAIDDAGNPIDRLT